MLNEQEQANLFEAYGPLINRVSRREAYRSNAIYGYRIVDPKDIAQDVFIQLVRTEISVWAFQETIGAEGWIRKTARFMSQNAIDKTLGSVKDPTGRRVGRVTIWDPLRIDADIENEDPSPHEVFEFDRLVETVQAEVWRIVNSVEAKKRETLVAFYLRGEPTDTSAQRQRRSRAHNAISPEDHACLQTWRAYAFPTLKKPPKVDALPLALMDACQSY